jgi:predicted DNA-binding antitoxin AbrB/MazE fold protein
MMRILHGVVHGRTIELTDHPGFKEGAAVEIEVRDVSNTGPVQQSSIRGVSDWSEEDDRIFEEIERERKATMPRDIDP